MPLLQPQLQSGLANLVPTDQEAEAAANFADAWASYFAGASVMGVPIDSGILEGAKATLQSALAGMSAPDAGAQVITSALTQFWGVIASGAAAAWIIPPNTVVSATPPPAIGSIAGALAAAWASNSQNPNITIELAAQSMSAILHGSGGLGGIAIVQPPPPAGPVPTPIL